MFVVNPDKYLLPDYKISPFQTQDISLNSSLPFEETIDDYFRDRFGHSNFYYTLNGRQALNQILVTYTLKQNDVVTIVTTSGNNYISSCVTNEIDKFCRWKREVTKDTKLILVIHEFGYPFGKIAELKAYNLPIVEDCAYSFFSETDDYQLGAVGEFSVYSFPKMFPIQLGGMMISNKGPQAAVNLSKDITVYLKSVLSYYIKMKDEILTNRINNYLILQDRLRKVGLEPRFDLQTGIVPGVYMFRSNGKINLALLKEYLFGHGIQCSVFYGEESFFIPVHQALSKNDLDYITHVITLFSGQFLK